MMEIWIELTDKINVLLICLRKRCGTYYVNDFNIFFVEIATQIYLIIGCFDILYKNSLYFVYKISCVTQETNYKPRYGCNSNLLISILKTTLEVIKTGKKKLETENCT